MPLVTADKSSIERILRSQRLLDRAAKLFKEEYNTWYEMTTSNGTVQVHIHWGDWKHDHAFVDYIFTQVLGAKHYSTDITEEDGSDCYSAIHTFIA